MSALTFHWFLPTTGDSRHVVGGGHGSTPGAAAGDRPASIEYLGQIARTAEQLGFDNAEFFPVQPKIERAHYAVSDAPGLGVEVNEELIRKQSFKFWEAPHLKRHDGSVTNW